MEKARQLEAWQRRKYLLDHQTKAELETGKILKSLNIPHQPQAIFFLDDHHYRIADFYIPKPFRIVIELDGSSHDPAKVQSYDNWKDRKLITRNHRFRILRFKNDEVFKPEFKALISEKLGKIKTRVSYKQGARKFKKFKHRFYRKKQKMTGRFFDLGKSVVAMSHRKQARYSGLHFVGGFRLHELKSMGML